MCVVALSNRSRRRPSKPSPSRRRRNSCRNRTTAPSTTSPSFASRWASSSLSTSLASTVLTTPHGAATSTALRSAGSKWRHSRHAIPSLGSCLDFFAARTGTRQAAASASCTCSTGACVNCRTSDASDASHKHCTASATATRGSVRRRRHTAEMPPAAVADCCCKSSSSDSTTSTAVTRSERTTGHDASSACASVSAAANAFTRAVLRSSAVAARSRPAARRNDAGSTVTPRSAMSTSIVKKSRRKWDAPSAFQLRDAGVLAPSLAPNADIIFDAAVAISISTTGFA
ncbi:hypothetical protein DQ04_15221010 [Trypanosoma grayi]|uniref:hypothetical protein n=1 Tax=Trypanosoma grayi TaxID=71804 RepID=UPI0004F4A390|nr:hypothetical protein DQ04_15221010 [Trypanosoma grayi]KEG06215.1 hypothetical protein DQ04_15221010 [Trypanosoma grayi]